MAADLQRQQGALERTHRLEAWADMARQVAHEIKNPLTPIQLSAEHLRRVHADRGTPLSPVLEELRRLDPQPGAAAAADRRRVLELRVVAHAAAGRRPARRTCVAEVVEPYRAGLPGARRRSTVDVAGGPAGRRRSIAA